MISNDFSVLFVPIALNFLTAAAQFMPPPCDDVCNVWCSRVVYIVLYCAVQLSALFITQC